MQQVRTSVSTALSPVTELFYIYLARGFINETMVFPLSLPTTSPHLPPLLMQWHSLVLTDFPGILNFLNENSVKWFELYKFDSCLKTIWHDFNGVSGWNCGKIVTKNIKVDENQCKEFY